MAQKPEQQQPDLYCLDCGTDLQRDRFEYVCPSDGHRFVVKDSKLAPAERVMAGPGPDGVPDRRRYPSLDGGIARRTVEPKDGRPRQYDPIDEEHKRREVEARRGRFA